MPLVNVIRGERIPDAPLNLRTKILRIPIWLALMGWTLRTVGRLLVRAVRHWYATGPAVLFGLAWVEYGWRGPAVLAGLVGATAAVWRAADRRSFERFALWPTVGRLRRIGYRRRWLPAMATAGLAVHYDEKTVIPVLRRVTSDRIGDTLLIKMVSGQIPGDFAKAGERLMHTFNARAVRVTAGRRPDAVVLRLLRRDPLTHTVLPYPVLASPDYAGLPVGLAEDGTTYRLRLAGTHVLVVGATGSGKGSVIWSLVRALAGAVASGEAQLWAFDPKGGMELGGGANLFTRFACEDYASMADMLDEALSVVRARATRLRGITRQHAPSVADPLLVLVIDELATLTAYLHDRHTRDRIRTTLGLLLSQGRAVGVHVVAALQDPRKEILPFRNLFPTRIGLRLAEAGEVDLVLGDGMRDRGALCDRVPESLPGVGYVVLDGDPTPVRVRFSYLTDADIAAMAAEFGPTRREVVPA